MRWWVCRRLGSEQPLSGRAVQRDPLTRGIWPKTTCRNAINQTMKLSHTPPHADDNPGGQSAHMQAASPIPGRRPTPPSLLAGYRPIFLSAVGILSVKSNAEAPSRGGILTWVVMVRISEKLVTDQSEDPGRPSDHPTTHIWWFSGRRARSADCAGCDPIPAAAWAVLNGFANLGGQRWPFPAECHRRWRLAVHTVGRTICNDMLRGISGAMHDDRGAVSIQPAITRCPAWHDVAVPSQHPSGRFCWPIRPVL